MDAYLAVCVCNFDDVVLGVYPHTGGGLAAAHRRMNRVAHKPELRLKLKHQATDTEPLWCRVWEVRRSTRLTCIAEVPVGKAKSRMRSGPARPETKGE